MCFSLSLVPVMLYPTLRNAHATLAVGYVIFRGALETTVGISMAISQLLLVLVGQQYATAGATDLPAFQILGAFILKSYNAINPLLIITFSLGALILYVMLYQSRLVPRWVSVWGLIAIALHFSTAFFILFHVVRADDMSTLFTINFPIFLQEMVMAVWLIVRGFKSSAITPRSAQMSINARQISMGR